MSITNDCPYCGNHCTFPDGSFGRKARCLTCQQIFTIEEVVPRLESAREPFVAPVEESPHIAPVPSRPLKPRLAISPDAGELEPPLRIKAPRKSVGSLSRSGEKLGSLAQAARRKELNQIRGIFIAIGVLTILIHVLQLATLRSQIDEAIKKEVEKSGPGFQVDPVKKAQVIEVAMRIGRVICFGMIGVGCLYLLFAVIVHQYPVPVTIIGLIIYVGAAVIFLVLDPEHFATGLVIKIVVTVLLANSIKTAIAYQRERDRTEAEAIEMATASQLDAEGREEVEPEDE
jgi:hypothetical protein